MRRGFYLFCVYMDPNIAYSLRELGALNGANLQVLCTSSVSHSWTAGRLADVARAALSLLPEQRLKRQSDELLLCMGKILHDPRAFYSTMISRVLVCFGI